MRMIVLFAALVYFFIASLAASFYNWQSIKDLGLARWAGYGGILATSKALVWPYFLLADKINTPTR